MKRYKLIRDGLQDLNTSKIQLQVQNLTLASLNQAQEKEICEQKLFLLLALYNTLIVKYRNQSNEKYLDTERDEKKRWTKRCDSV